MNEIEAYVQVKAKLAGKLGQEISDEQVRTYLDRRGLSPEEWLEEDAELLASIPDAPERVPDPEQDPEGYQHYLDSQYPPGL